MRNTKKGPRDVVDVSWAIDEFFCLSYFFSVANKIVLTADYSGDGKDY
jgi:hypothetical protein